MTTSSAFTVACAACSTPPAAESAAVLSVFDNEEVGGGTKQGADSSFLEDVLCRVSAALGRGDVQYRAALTNSFMVSADNAHAVHPNHPSTPTATTGRR